MVSPPKQAKLTKEQLLKLSEHKLKQNGSTFKLLASKIQQRLAIQRDALCQYSIFKSNAKQPILNAHCNTTQANFPVEYQCYMNNLNITETAPPKYVATKLLARESKSKTESIPCFPFPQYYYVYISGRLKHRTSSFTNTIALNKPFYGDCKRVRPPRPLKQAIYKLGSISKKQPCSRSHVHLTDDAYDEEFEDRMLEMDEILRGHPPCKKAKLELIPANSTDELFISLYGPNHVLDNEANENSKHNSKDSVKCSSDEFPAVQKLMEAKKLSSFLRQCSEDSHNSIHTEQVRRIHEEFPQIEMLKSSLNFLPADESAINRLESKKSEAKQIEYENKMCTPNSSAVAHTMDPFSAMFLQDSIDGENQAYMADLENNDMGAYYCSDFICNNSTSPTRKLCPNSASKPQMCNSLPTHHTNQPSNTDECLVEISLHRPPYKTNKAFEARTKAIREKQIRLEMEKHTKSASFARLRARRMKLMSFVSFQDVFRPLGMEEDSCHYDDDPTDEGNMEYNALSSQLLNSKNVSQSLLNKENQHSEDFEKTDGESAVQVFPVSGLPRTISSRLSTKRSISSKAIDGGSLDPLEETGSNFFEQLQNTSDSSQEHFDCVIPNNNPANLSRGITRQFLSEQQLSSNGKTIDPYQTPSGTIFNEKNSRKGIDVTSLPIIEEHPEVDCQIATEIGICERGKSKSSNIGNSPSWKNGCNKESPRRCSLNDDFDVESVHSGCTVTLDDFSTLKTDRKMSRSSFLSRLSRAKLSSKSLVKNDALDDKKSSTVLPENSIKKKSIDHFTEMNKLLSDIVSIGKSKETSAKKIEEISSQVESLYLKEDIHSSPSKTAANNEFEYELSGSPNSSNESFSVESKSTQFSCANGLANASSETLGFQVATRKASTLEKSVRSGTTAVLCKTSKNMGPKTSNALNKSENEIVSDDTNTKLTSSKSLCVHKDSGDTNLSIHSDEKISEKQDTGSKTSCTEKRSSKAVLSSSECMENVNIAKKPR